MQYLFMAIFVLGIVAADQISKLLVVANIGLQPVMNLQKLVLKHILTLLIRYMKSLKA